MNTKFFCALLLSFCLLLSACRYSKDDQVINVNNQFSLALPSWVKEDKALKDNAVLQYANHFRNFYVIGEVAGQAKSADELMTENLNILRKSLKTPVVTDSVEVTGNGIKGTRVEIYGKMSDENIYFSEVIYQGKKNIYHLSIWTRGEARKLHFKEDINKIIASFREI